MTCLARKQPDRPASVALSEPEWKALYAYTPHSPHEPAEAPAPRHAVRRWIGQSGGFLGRAHDGEPGVRVLWRGMQGLTDIVAGWGTGGVTRSRRRQAE